MKKLSRLCVFLLAFLQIFTFSVYQDDSIIHASTMKDAKETKSLAEKQLEESKNKIDELEEKNEEIKKEMEKLDESLVSILADISILEDEIFAKKEEIKHTEKEYKVAKEIEKKQQDAMKLRIKYMYENNNSDIITSITTDKNISSAINQSTLQEDVYKYDRQQLEEYERASALVKNLMAKLEEDKQILEENENTLKEKEKELKERKKEKENESNEFLKQIDDAEKVAEEYKKLIEEQNKVIEEEMKKLYASASVGAYDLNYRVQGEGEGVEIANYALQFLGHPYVYGGTSLENGIDCSAFVQAVYAHFGYQLPRTSDMQRYSGYEVSVDELLPGDLICYSGHIAIYLGYGKIVHASSEKTGIKISNNFQYKNIVSMRRIVDGAGVWQGEEMDVDGENEGKEGEEGEEN